ncbi:uncharacterized protein VTP21DRAFT_10036 [Calcarisporiella thermophila]|uniref:uncharacterized protein n=1 Tax=Calcarisporiella thermophila TaxID=911321 RepID=UPI003742C6E4
MLDSLELDLHSLILDQLAELLVHPKAGTTDEDLNRLFARLPYLPEANGGLNGVNGDKSLWNLNKRHENALKALAKYTLNVSEDRQHDLVKKILAYIEHLPDYTFEENLNWKQYAPADRVTNFLTTSLLKIANKNSKVSRTIVDSVWAYMGRLTSLVKSGNADYVCSFVLPSLNGLFRAIQNSEYPWLGEHLHSLVEHTRELINDDSLLHIEESIASCLKSTDNSVYSRRLLAKYWESGNPLSNNRIILDILLAARNMLAKILTSNSRSKQEIANEDNGEQTSTMNTTRTDPSNPVAQNFPALFEMLLQCGSDISLIEHQKALRGLYVLSLGFHDEIQQVRDACMLEARPTSLDLYIQGILAGSLHVAGLCSIGLREIDDSLIGKVNSGLQGTHASPDVKVDSASLDIASVLALNFPQTTTNMLNLMRRYLTSPSDIFEQGVNVPGTNCSIMDYAIRRLAQCLKGLPGEKVALSTLYSLQNTIAIVSGAAANDATNAPAPSVVTSRSDSSSAYDWSVYRNKEEGERLQVCQNAVAAMSGIACYCKNDKVTASTFSMLAERRRQSSPELGAFILAKLVDLAVIAPENLFSDITLLFSTIAKEPSVDEDEVLANAIINAHHDLSKRIESRPELYQKYLIKLLSLFTDKGVQIQQQANSKLGRAPRAAETKELGSLLPVVSSLLMHNKFSPHEHPTEEITSLFRNLWFLCVLYGFVNDVGSWREAMRGIALKTPSLVLETATNYLESDLEYNSVLRRGFSDHDLVQFRNQLTGFLPAQANDIRTFSFAQTVFLLAVYHSETMRGRQGNPSFVLRYFANQGVANSRLTNCMEAIADQVFKVYMNEIMRRATIKAVDENMQHEVRQLLISCCHRLSKIHILSVRYVDRLVGAFPQLLCDRNMVHLLLELVQLLWCSCEGELTDEYCPRYQFTSPRMGVTLDLGDSYTFRREMLTRLCDATRHWLLKAMNHAPLTVSGLLQDYLSEYDPFQDSASLHMGRSIALEIGRTIPKIHDNSCLKTGASSLNLDGASEFISSLTAKGHFRGEISGTQHYLSLHELAEHTLAINNPRILSDYIIEEQVPFIRKQLEDLTLGIRQRTKVVSPRELHVTLNRAAAVLITLPKVDEQILRYLCWIPVYLFTPESLKIGTAIWNWMCVERPETEDRIMVEMATAWSWSQKHRKGLFSDALNGKDPFEKQMSYSPSDLEAIKQNIELANFLFGPHLTWMEFLASRFQSFRYRNRHMVDLVLRVLQMTFDASGDMSTHPLALQPRFRLALLGFKVLEGNRLEALCEHMFRSRLYNAAFSWFALPPSWGYGGNKVKMMADIKLLHEFYKAVEADQLVMDTIVTYRGTLTAPVKSTKIAGLTREEIMRWHEQSKRLLLLATESELNRRLVWNNPLNAPNSTQVAPGFTSKVERSMTEENWKHIVRFAWTVSPRLAIQLAARYKVSTIRHELQNLVSNNPMDAVDLPEALQFLLGDGVPKKPSVDLKYLLYWAPVPPIIAASYFLPAYNNHPLILQYAMRSLEHFSVNIVFFYVPQLVQALRYDELGYVEQFILEAAGISQLFAHQIIWNMKANMFRDADKEAVIPDPLKPKLESVIERIVGQLSGEAKAFYEREFKFFGEVTGISGKLKPYIQKSKAEKKAKIDEEMAKIKVDVGVYLPSNPEGIVVDIDYKSGKPLQSHAKAPFLATFKIRKTKEDSDAVRAAIIKGQPAEQTQHTVDVWQSAIFKVGDDCRQDVLALQLIAIFKNIYADAGLDLYVFPYRIVATAPGCGVIDVIPRSISRDMLGREKINNLYDWFLIKYGGLDSIAFQKARNNYIQSVSAYSVISYLLAIKDRHNGNIMLDEDGHTIHIDFGFILDIAPGGITFESSPFKLTTEMIQLMGGGGESQAYRQFCELCVKSYLAARPYAEQIVQTVVLMLGSGLPCFKGEQTIRKLRARFQLDRSERQAADFMLERIKDSYENRRTVLYDEFQRITNGIPY